MRAPTIHLNGTSGEALLDQATSAAQALREALEAMGRAAPNARDYYVQGPEAFPLADDAHDARCAAVRALIAEYEELAEALADALDERRGR